MLVATVQHTHRSRRSKRKSKKKEDIKSQISKCDTTTIPTPLSSKSKSSEIYHNDVVTKQNIWDRLKKQQSKHIYERKNAMKLFCIKPFFIDKRDLNVCIAIHMTLINCGLIKNTFLMESTIIKEIAEYSTGLCLNCKQCGKESCTLYENVVNEQELCQLWQTRHKHDILNGKGYLSRHYNNEQEKQCHNLYYCQRCLPLKMHTHLCKANRCGKPVMDITENVLRVSDTDIGGSIIRIYHYDCYMHEKKINDELIAKRRTKGYLHSFYNTTIKMSVTRHKDVHTMF